MLQSPFVTQFGIFAVEVGWPILAVFARVGLFPSIPFSVSISAPHLGGQRNRYRQGISVRASKTAKIAVGLVFSFVLASFFLRALPPPPLPATTNAPNKFPERPLGYFFSPKT